MMTAGAHSPVLALIVGGLAMLAEGAAAPTAESRSQHESVARDRMIAIEAKLRTVDAWRVRSERPEPVPRLLSPDERLVFDQTHGRPVADADDECDDEAFASRTGDALVAHIRATPYDCINRLFSQASTRFAAFRKQNMIDVATATTPVAMAYDGTNAANIVELFLFLRAGFFVAFFEGDQLDWAGSSRSELPTRSLERASDDADVAAAAARLLDAFRSNPRFYDETPEHSDVLWEAVTLMDGAGLQARYVPEAKAWLQRWRPALLEVEGLGSAINAFFVALFRGHFYPAFVDTTAADTELATVLREFAFGDWMLGADAEYLVENAGRELARFTQYGDAPIYPVARDGVRAILARYAIDGEGAGIWVATATGAVYYDDCAVYDICGFEAELEPRVLAIRHACGDTVTVRAQDLGAEELDRACTSLKALESYFHRRLRTGGIPVADDFNASLEVVVFADSAAYETYSPIFFGNPTDNGGIYLEGDPSDPGNTARFIAYVATWLEDRPIWNLEHEFAHYLDGRFNLRGSFDDYRVDTHYTVWWAEGLAEYMTKRNDNPDAVETGRSRDVKLSQVFPTVYSGDATAVYAWTYLGIRFMFERHRDVVDSLVGLLREGDYDAYRRYLREDVGTAYDAEWDAWLQRVASGGHDTPELVELPGALVVDEGASAEYRIALATMPTADVALDIAVEGVDIAVAPTSMTFTPEDWDAVRTVRITAPEDDDGAHEAATLLHTALGGGYDRVRAAVAVTVMDSAPPISFAEAATSVREGETALLELRIGRGLDAAVTFAYRLGPDEDPATYDADADDHAAADGEVRFPAGETSATIEIPIRADEDIEPARETLAVAMVPSTIYAFAAGTTTVAVVIEEGVCDRTPAVRDALRDGRDCAAPDIADVAGTYALNLTGNSPAGCARATSRASGASRTSASTTTASKLCQSDSSRTRTDCGGSP